MKKNSYSEKACKMIIENYLQKDRRLTIQENIENDKLYSYIFDDKERFAYRIRNERLITCVREKDKDKKLLLEAVKHREEIISIIKSYNKTAMFFHTKDNKIITIKKSIIKKFHKTANFFYCKDNPTIIWVHDLEDNKENFVGVIKGTENNV